MDSGIIVWFICLIPVVVTGAFYIMKPKQFVWWELIFPVVLSLMITFGIKLLTDHINVTQNEVWGSSVIAVYEHEPWNEWVHRICETCTTDSDGNESCTSYDCSYQDDHPPRWSAETNLGKAQRISEHQYDSISKLWGYRYTIKTIKNHSRNSRAVGSTGTKFEGTKVGETSQVIQSKWNELESSRIPYSSKHSYENKVRASDATVFDIKVVTEGEADTLGLFEYMYPKDGLDFPTILSKVKLPDSVQNKFNKLNAKFGPTNRMRLWVLVYEDVPQTIGHYQENYWVKGNFNELVICVSVDEAKIIQWAHVFSWTLNTELPIETRNAVLGAGALNKEGWDKISGWLESNLDRYEKRSHEEFSYLKVTPPTWAIILNIVITIGISVGINLWVSSNEFTEENPKGEYRYKYRRY